MKKRGEHLAIGLGKLPISSIQSNVMSKDISSHKHIIMFNKQVISHSESEFYHKFVAQWRLCGNMTAAIKAK